MEDGFVEELCHQLANNNLGLESSSWESVNICPLEGF